ncbi:MAG: hypothetical protein HY678_09125 [Chloroflexi bacterium]|nr:hypothetical protein [Chloroflexota bacterium]
MTDQGKAFQSISARSSDPVAAWKLATGASAPAPEPATSGEVSGATGDESSIESLVDQAIKDRFGSYDADLALWRIQFGTAPRMVELTDHFNLMWFAAQAGNWNFVDFEIYRSDESLKAIEVTRPARTAALRAWWQPAQTELEEASKAQDLAAFTKAYDQAIAGCNSCHVASVGGGISLKGVKVVRPAAPLLPNLDYAGN